MHIEAASMDFGPAGKQRLRLVPGWAVVFTIRTGRHRDRITATREGLSVNDGESVPWGTALKALVLHKEAGL